MPREFTRQIEHGAPPLPSLLHAIFGETDGRSHQISGTHRMFVFAIEGASGLFVNTMPKAM
jgi:hypothetical protein|tara:strand:- start:118 stop:300 length:183 start_codon:yes stop_codon:yes gene_type:complete